MFGWGYVKDTCIALYQKEQKEEIYKIYISDCLKNINLSIAERYGGNYTDLRYYDLINPKKQTYEKGEITEKIKSKFRNKENPN